MNSIRLLLSGVFLLAVILVVTVFCEDNRSELQIEEMTTPLTRGAVMRSPSNCYMLKPGGNDMWIPVDQVNHFARVLDLPDVIEDSTAFETVLLWSDVRNLITSWAEGKGKSGAVKVTSNSDPSVVGNAVIALKAGNEIKWSWHIWVTDYAPDPKKDTWLDRNLGATSQIKGDARSLGLYYQWGRKDPFPGSASAKDAVEPIIYSSMDTNGFEYRMSENNVSGLGSPTLVKKRQTIDWTIKHPLVFIGYSGSWMVDSKVNDINWNSTNNKKTLFDPCPEGYRVPPVGSLGEKEDWDDFSWDEVSRGRDTYAVYGGWYPAAGRRSNVSGTLYSQGNKGYYWFDSLEFNTSGHYLYLYPGTVFMNNSFCRSSGFSIRCIAESL